MPQEKPTLDSSPALAARVHQAIADWYAANARGLPWRGSSDPYAILVSEVMLQQTQVERVVPKYREFLAAFPTLTALAESPPAEIIRVWAPLGYNGRAVRLHRLAQTVVREHGGRLPQTVPELRKLPGLGPYTAAAVASFAFGARVAVLDTNVYRVLSRVVHGVEPPAKRALEDLATEWLPGTEAPLTPSAWHQCLMDVGATICTAARPRCMLCPMREDCAAAPLLQSGNARALAEASVPYSPKQGAFAGSRRYFRGRAVDALRALPPGESLALAEVTRLVSAGGQQAPATGAGPGTEAWTLALVEELARDGLARADTAGDGTVTVRLP